MYRRLQEARHVMPVIIAVIVALLVGFWFGQGTGDDDKGYEVIHRDKRVEVQVEVPVGMPAPCLAAGELLTDLQVNTEEVDRLTGRLGTLAEHVSTFTDQPDSQKYINERKQEITDLQERVARIGISVMDVTNKYAAAQADCDTALQEYE